MRSILKQTSWLFFAQALTRIIGFFYTIFLARSLGVLDFGIYSVALAYFSIISSISDFGFNRFLIREIARDKGKLWEIIWNVLMLRLTIVSVSFAIFATSLYLLDPDRSRVSIVLLATLAVLPQAIAITFDGIFIALQKLQFSAISALVLSIATVFFGMFLMNHGLGVYGAVSALILGQIIYALTLIYLILKNQGFSKSEVNVATFKKVLLGSLPYGLLAVLGLLYFRIDTVLLSYMRGNFETGIYAAGYKFLEALVFIPNALAFALFPAFARLHEKDSKKIKGLFTKSIVTMFIFGCLVTVSFILILPFIIQIFLPKFTPAIEIIKILSLSIPFMFVYIPAAAVLTSTDKYLKQVILFSMIPLTFNILLNLIFIPDYGLLAASWITVGSDVLSAFILFIFIRKYIFKNG